MGNAELVVELPGTGRTSQALLENDGTLRGFRVSRFPSIMATLLATALNLNLLPRGY